MYLTRNNNPSILGKKSAFLAIAITAIGCASSGVMPLGPDTYTISTSSEFSPVYAKKQALNEAMAYCKSLGKEMMPMRTQRGGFVDSFGDSQSTFDYTFRCLAVGDSMLSRPSYKDPTVNVNINKKSEESININKSGSSSSDLYTELQKLNQLKIQGILTEEEFQEQKKKVLGQY